MAAYVRSVTFLVSRKHHAFLSRDHGVVVESKRYVRALKRRPVRVLFPDNDAGAAAEKTQQQPWTTEQHVAAVAAAHRRHETVSDKATSHQQPAVKHKQVPDWKDPDDDLRFERAQPGDKRLGRLVSVARSRTFREHQGKILLEGRRLICDALDAGAVPQMVFFSTVDRLRELPKDKLKRATLLKVKFEDIKIWSDLVAPQGVIAIFSRPDPSRLTFASERHAVPLSLICDNIRDPGNLGTMLRCAAAAGCHNVLLTKGCVDVWEPKVLRAAMGAHFRVPIYPSLDWEDIENRLPQPVTVHVADNSCGTDRSNEDLPVNVSPKSSKAGDYGWIRTRRSQSDTRYEEYDTDSDSEDEGLSLPRVDAKLYYRNWAQGPSALVIGGETHGLSLESVQLAEKTGGHRLFIPVVPNVDSLNSAMAASILLFEGRKQLLQLMQTSRGQWKSKGGGQSP